MKMKRSPVYLNNLSHNQSGMTLVEIMIAMSITLFMLAGIMGIYISSKQAYRVQNNLSRLQENARFTLDYLAKNIRMAGYVGCQRSVVTDTASGNPIDLDDFFYIVDYDGSNWDSELLGTSDHVKPNTDILIIKRGEVAEFPLNPTVNKSDPIQISNSNHLQIDDVALISNCSHAEVFNIEDIYSGLITHASFRKQYGADSDGDGEADDKAVVMKLLHSMYYIHDNNGQHSLRIRTSTNITGEEVVEGVDNLQIDIDNDNNTFTINLLMRSLENGVATPSKNGSTKKIAFHNTLIDIAAHDLHLYKSYSMTINRRN